MTLRLTLRLASIALIGCLTAEPVRAQSTVRPIPRIERHELTLFSIAPDVINGPRSDWAELDGSPIGEP
ncbi:MAG: hypothetical protein AAFZ65_03665, partial [Planctomycetota bacterium]